MLLAETGNGKPLVKCSAKIEQVIRVDSEDDWNRSYHFYTGIEPGSRYDWKPGETKVKYLYHMTKVEPCEPFTPPEGTRHGRVWMEYKD